MAEQRIGRYSILEEIAAGTQGTVHRAFDAETGQIVAVKVLHPSLSGDRNYLERFHREATITSSIDHPNVVRIQEVGEADGRHFIAMEFLPESLGRVIQSAGRLPVPASVSFAVQIADGLAAAHARGVVHRDIKPQNVLIAADGTAKVTDFGIARGESLATMTATGMMMGTPYYMSPEQCRGERADARSDIYSLGCVLYQMLTGELPFEASTPWAILRMHTDEAPRPLREVRDDVPQSVAGVVARALEKEANRRFGNAGEMGRATRAAVAGTSTAPVRPPVSRPAPTPTSEHVLPGGAVTPPERVRWSVSDRRSVMKPGPPSQRVLPSEAHAPLGLDSVEANGTDADLRAEADALNEDIREAQHALQRALDARERGRRDRIKGTAGVSDEAEDRSSASQPLPSSERHEPPSPSSTDSAANRLGGPTGLRRAAAAKNSEGLALFTAGRYEAAIAAFSEAIALQPDFEAVYRNRAEAHRRLGRAAPAAADAYQASSLERRRRAMRRRIEDRVAGNRGDEAETGQRSRSGEPADVKTGVWSVAGGLLGVALFQDYAFLVVVSLLAIGYGAFRLLRGFIRSAVS